MDSLIELVTIVHSSLRRVALGRFTHLIPPLQAGENEESNIINQRLADLRAALQMASGIKEFYRVQFEIYPGFGDKLNFWSGWSNLTHLALHKLLLDVGLVTNIVALQNLAYIAFHEAYFDFSSQPPGLDPGSPRLLPEQALYLMRRPKLRRLVFCSRYGFFTYFQHLGNPWVVAARMPLEGQVLDVVFVTARFLNEDGEEWMNARVMDGTLWSMAGYPLTSPPPSRGRAI